MFKDSDLFNAMITMFRPFFCAGKKIIAFGACIDMEPDDSSVSQSGYCCLQLRSKGGIDPIGPNWRDRDCKNPVHCSR